MGKTVIISKHMSFAKNNIGQVHLSEYDDMNIFNIKAITDITIRFTNNFEYNSGASFYWKQYEANTELELRAGLDLMIRSELVPTSENGIGTFDIDGEFSISGDITYLLNDNELTAYAFKNLFNGCDTLIDASHLSLPDITEQSCYEAMFKNCTSIEIAPVLPATSLSTNCYKEMFYGCSSLNEIIIKSEDLLGEDYSYNWVYGVAEEGTFKPVIGIEHETGVHGCPTNWECSADFINMYFTIESLQDNNTITAIRNGSSQTPLIYYSFDNGITWNNLTLSSGTWTFGTINKGDKIIFKSEITNWANAWDKYNKFNGSKNFKVYGNVMSLLNGDNFINNSEFDTNSTHNLAGLFYGTSTLIDASNLILPATTLCPSSYNGMFRGCINLEYGPKILPALVIPADAYSSMFETCRKLVEAPEILATSVSGDTALNRMFCMSRTSKETAALTKGPILRIKNPSAYNNVYQQLFSGNGNLTEVTIFAEGKNLSFTNWLAYTTSGVITKLYTTTLTSGNNGVPSTWTTEDYLNIEE